MEREEQREKIPRIAKKIGTHDGSFHVDEALACFMLRMTTEYAHAEVVRSRDPTVLSALPLLCDVGGVYDVATHRFDHHQRSFVETFDDKHDIRLSSAGLVYKHFGREVVAKILALDEKEPAVELLYQRTYDNFILALDGVDNGVPQYPSDIKPRYRVGTALPSRVAALNPDWNEDGVDVQERFHQAMEMAGAEFVQYVARQGKSWLPARQIVVDSLAASLVHDPSGEIVVLTRACPWKEHLLELEAENGWGDRTCYVLFADASLTWRVQSVPDGVDSFGNRCPLPALWRGLRDAELSQVTGVAQCIFVHANGFIGGNHTFEGALVMARKALFERLVASGAHRL